LRQPRSEEEKLSREKPPPGPHLAPIRVHSCSLAVPPLFPHAFHHPSACVSAPRGEKTSLLEAAIDRQTGDFGVTDLQKACPGVGIDLVRKVLKRLKGQRVECLGRGQTARWRKLN
jgi:hypothetical protein